MKTTRYLFSALVAMVAIAAGVETAMAQATVQLSGSVPAEALKMPTYGDLPSAQILPLQIWFKPRNQKQLNALLAAQQDPKSPHYHKWLTPAEYSKRFGVTQEEFDKVARWLGNQGFQVTGGSSAEGFIRFNGTVLSVVRAFNTRLMKFSRDGSKFGNLTEPELPAEYAGLVGSITGLNNLMRIVPMNHPVKRSPSNTQTPAATSGSAKDASRGEPVVLADSSDGPELRIGLKESFAPSDAYTFYNETPLTNSGITGNTGNDCIAIFGDSDVTSGPLNAFTTQFMNSNAVNLTRVNADGQTQGTFSGDEVEALLDIEWAHAIAPGAKISLYLDGDIGHAVNRVATDNA
jgi:subtilase family serine protease